MNRLFFFKLWVKFTRFLYQNIILVLTLLFCIGIGVALANMSRLSNNLIQSQALQNATLYAQALQEARTLYSSEVVRRAISTEQIIASHDYLNQEAAIPLPATFLIELGERIRKTNPGMSVRLYSEYPFPWRKETGGARDEFELKALQVLQENPNQLYYETVNNQGKVSFRYAQADILKPSCVECHNTHPNTPKTDWKVGDMRGILEITQPLDAITQQVHQGLQETFFMLVGLSVLGISGLTLVIGQLRHNSQELEQRVIRRTAQLQEANLKLVTAQEKSERLLLSILPQPIAEQLKEGKSSIAEGFASVTILFADIVGFTILSQKIPPQELVKLLNEIFSDFDRLSDRYGLEKIKTIGDAYMAVGGLPNPCENHAQLVAEMALDMQQDVAKFNKKHRVKLSIRIGINTGPVVAGVIGTKKFIYDLWGDAVNTASRMESHGISGAIQVSQETYQLLQNQYIFKERGVIKIKGKGEMKTYLLIGRKIATVEPVSSRR